MEKPYSRIPCPFGPIDCALFELPVPTRGQAICTMLAWIDGTLTEDMRAKGLNTRRHGDGEGHGEISVGSSTWDFSRWSGAQGDLNVHKPLKWSSEC